MYLASPRDTFPTGIYIVFIDHHRKLKLHSARIEYIIPELPNSLCPDTHEKQSIPKEGHILMCLKKYLYEDCREVDQGVIKKYIIEVNKWTTFCLNKKTTLFNVPDKKI